MAKLPDAYRFIDLSDYGRPAARFIASSLKVTTFTPIHVTIGFIISGLLAVACIIFGLFWAAAFFLIFKAGRGSQQHSLVKHSVRISFYENRYI